MLEKEFGQHRESKIKSPKSHCFYTNSNGQRIKVRRRGKNRYFVYIQERFGDLYCFLKKSITVPEMKDNFQINECVFVHSDINEVRNFLINLSKEKHKSITFSLHSIKIN